MGWRGKGVKNPPEKSQKYIGFLSNIGPELLKSTKLPSQHSMLGHHRNASETPIKWRFAGGPMMAYLWWYLVPPPIIKKKKKTQKSVAKLKRL